MLTLRVVGKGTLGGGGDGAWRRAEGADGRAEFLWH